MQIFSLLLVILISFCVSVTSQSFPLNSPSLPPLDDNIALQVQGIWKSIFPSAILLPGIGLPSQNQKNYLILTHTANLPDPTMYINNIPCKNPLCVNALYSAEYVNNGYTNYYEIMLDDIPGINGLQSSVSFYTQSLQKRGLILNGFHFHWTGVKNPVLAIHHTSPFGMSPTEFSIRTIGALQEYFNYNNYLQQKQQQQQQQQQQLQPQQAPQTNHNYQRNG